MDECRKNRLATEMVLNEKGSGTESINKSVN